MAAALLQQQGYQVIGVTMQLWPAARHGEEERPGGCCGIEAVTDAKRVAYKLGIPHYVLNLRDVFSRQVIADFCREYLRGRTPNPCIRCNRHIKFDALLGRTQGLGADFIATGHHARIERDGATGRYLLKKGRDRRKDQSYFLYPLTQEQMGRTLMPVGNLTKERVREIAAGLGLPVAAKPESQEICFITDDDYPAFLREWIPGAGEPGPILDRRGKVLGRHRGIMAYTIGQRRGLGIAAAEPLYVTGIEPATNAVVVGGKEEIYGDGLTAADLNWIALTGLEVPLTARARIRYAHREAEATLTPLAAGQIYVKFAAPQLALTPGQAVVFYDGDTVLGGGTIERTGALDIAPAVRQNRDSAGCAAGG